MESMIIKTVSHIVNPTVEFGKFGKNGLTYYDIKWSLCEIV